MSWLPRRLPTRSHLVAGRNHRRAITLIELLVVIAIVALVAGVLLETMVSVDQGVRRGEAQLTMAWTAEQTAAGVTAVLRHAVAPSALDGDAGAGVYEFTPARCAVVVAGEPGRGLERATIEEQPGGESGQGACVRVQSAPLGAAQGAGPTTVPGTGIASVRFATTLAFEYATKISAVGFEPQFKPQLAPGEYPQLVRMRIRVMDLENVEKPYEIVTAVRLM